MLFSEPKIPQITLTCSCCHCRKRFSALQRAENSSNFSSNAAAAYGSLVSVLFSEPKIPQILQIERLDLVALKVSVLFSEPKIPQTSHPLLLRRTLKGFSALQRAENSSNVLERVAQNVRGVFQCSSASRKFLKKSVGDGCYPITQVSVLFSEPKIPQSYLRHRSIDTASVSVLFSEPKIPQIVRVDDEGDL